MEQLRPRAVTALVVLRSGICTRGRLADILGDDTVQQTDELLLALRDYGLIQSVSTGRTSWCLTHDGISWLQANGVLLTDRGQREVIDVYRRTAVGS